MYNLTWVSCDIHSVGENIYVYEKNRKFSFVFKGVDKRQIYATAVGFLEKVTKLNANFVGKGFIFYQATTAKDPDCFILIPALAVEEPGFKSNANVYYGYEYSVLENGTDNRDTFQDKTIEELTEEFGDLEDKIEPLNYLGEFKGKKIILQFSEMITLELERMLAYVENARDTQTLNEDQEERNFILQISTEILLRRMKNDLAHSPFEIIKREKE